MTPAEALGRCLALHEHARLNGLGPSLDEIPALLPLLDDAGVRGQMAKLFGVHAMRRRDFETATRYSEMAARDLPQDRETWTNLLVSLMQLERFDEVLDHARAGLAQHPECFDYHDVVTETLARLGRLDEARGHGTLSLALKDRQSTGSAMNVSGLPLPPFDPRRPERHIIAFSLYGGGERYCRGAIENARAQPYLYPGWTCRFHVDASVPTGVVAQLAAAGAQVALMDDLPATAYGTFWRYLVADDADVDRFLVRDADSVINTRERVAVDEWLASDRHFHVMRDEVRQSELVLAGMWGGVRGGLPPMRANILHFVGDPGRLHGRTADQVFLRQILWPTIRQSVLTHDSQFAFGERRDFPRLGQLPHGRSIGDWLVKPG